MKRGLSATEQQIAENKRRAIEIAKQVVGVARPVKPDQQKGFTAKTSKGGVDLSFKFEGLSRYQATKSGFGGSAEASIDSYTMRYKLSMPDQETLERIPTEIGRAYHNAETGEHGFAVRAYVSDDVRKRATNWNEKRAVAKAKFAAELRKGNADLSDEEVDKACFERYGEDIVIPAEPEVYFPASHLGYLPLCKTDKCPGIEKLREANKGDRVQIMGFKCSLSVRPDTDMKMYAGAKHEYPSGAARMYWSATSIKIYSMPDETRIRSLETIDEAQPGVENPHITHWLHKLSDLVSVAEASERKTVGPFLMRFTATPNFERFGLPSGMVTRTTITEEKGTGDQMRTAFLSGMPGAQYPTLDLLMQVTQWRQGAEETDVFDAERNEGWQYCVHATAYSKPLAEMGKQSHLGACPIASPSSWDKLAKYLCDGIEGFVEFNVNVTDSAANGQNVMLADEFADARGAARFQKYFYSLQTYVETLYVDWCRLVRRNGVPLSLKGAKMLLEQVRHEPEYACIPNSRNLVVALNTVPEKAATYLNEAKQPNGKPVWSYYAVAPAQLDDQRRETYAKLSEAYANGYTGSLGEVLFDETYRASDAEAVGAHEVLVADKTSKVPISASDIANVYVFAINERNYAAATSPLIVNKCLRNNFGFTMGDADMSDANGHDTPPPPLPPKEVEAEQMSDEDGDEERRSASASASASE